MRRRVLYIAEPIDQSDFGVWKDAVSTAISAARDVGLLVYRPATAWYVEPGTDVGPEIEESNRSALASASALIAFLPEGVPTVGVPREVEAAVAAGIPVLVVTDRRGWSLHDVETVSIESSKANYSSWLRAQMLQGRDGSPRLLPFTVEEPDLLPTRKYPGDAGFDLYVSQDVKIPPGEFRDVPTGVRVALPPGVWARIVGRSSTWRSRGLIMIEGIIDNGWRGELFSAALNPSDDAVVVKRGERLAQLILHDVVSSRYTPDSISARAFERIPGDGRGESGFGSTGL